MPVPDAKNLPTEVGYDDGLQSGGDPQCGWRACRWASLRCFLTVCAEIGTSGTLVEQLICDTSSGPAAPTPDQHSRFDTLMLRSRRMGQLWDLFNLMEEREGQLQISTGSHIVELRVEIQNSCWWQKEGRGKWTTGFHTTKRRRSHAWKASLQETQIMSFSHIWHTDSKFKNAHVDFGSKQHMKDVVSYSIRHVREKQRQEERFVFQKINHLSKNLLFHFQPGSCLMGCEILRWILSPASVLLCCTFS